MTKQSENRKIETIEKHWDGILQDFNKWFFGWWKPSWREIKIAMNKIIEEIWFSKEKTKGGKAFHIVIWLLVARAFIRLWYGV